jgi:hypothetical protein
MLKYVEGAINVAKIIIQHFFCGHTYPVRFNSFKHGNRCPECFKYKKQTKDIMIKYLEENTPDCFGMGKTTEQDIRNYLLEFAPEYELVKYVEGNIRETHTFFPRKTLQNYSRVSDI